MVPPSSTLFPYTTLFRSRTVRTTAICSLHGCSSTFTVAHLNRQQQRRAARHVSGNLGSQSADGSRRSEEHTSELQSRGHLVCRLLLEKKNKKFNTLSLI